MLIKQISVFLENKSGRLAEVSEVLGKNNIDIRALAIADTTDFGILRIIVDKPEEAEKILKENNFTVSCTNVVAISVEDKPGGLTKVLKILNDAKIGIEYMYAFVGNVESEALVIIRVEEAVTAVELLQKNNIRVLSSHDVYR